MCARYFMGNLVRDPLGDISIETVYWERANPFKQVLNFVYNWISIKLPWLRLDNLQRKLHIRKSKKR